MLPSMSESHTRKRTSLLIREDQLAQVMELTGAKSASDAVGLALARLLEAEEERRHLAAYVSAPDDLADEWGEPFGGEVPPDWSDVPWDDGPEPETRRDEPSR